MFSCEFYRTFKNTILTEHGDFQMHEGGDCFAATTEPVDE